MPSRTATSDPGTSGSHRRRRPGARRPRVGSGGGRALVWVLLWGYAVVALAPLLVMVLNSLRPSRDIVTVPLGLTLFVGERQTDWSTLSAGLVLATVPLVVLFLLATRQIVAGLTAGMSR